MIAKNKSMKHTDEQEYLGLVPECNTSSDDKHDFSDWKIEEDITGIGSGGTLIQSRICKKCRFKQINTQSY